MHNETMKNVSETEATPKPVAVSSVRAAQADARRRLRELESGRDAAVSTAVTALAKQEAHKIKAAKQAETLASQSATAVNAVTELLDIKSAAAVLGLSPAEVRSFSRQTGGK